MRAHTSKHSGGTHVGFERVLLVLGLVVINALPDAVLALGRRCFSDAGGGRRAGGVGEEREDREGENRRGGRGGENAARVAALEFAPTTGDIYLHTHTHTHTHIGRAHIIYIMARH